MHGPYTQLDELLFLSKFAKVIPEYIPDYNSSPDFAYQEST